MRASRAFAVAAAACVAVGLSAPVAAAGGDQQSQIHVSVSPQSVQPGGNLHITVQGCNRGGTITSNAFPQTNLPANRGGTSTATARIHNDASPGQYHLAVRCNDNPMVATAQFTVLPGRGAEGGLGGSVGPTSAEMAVGAGLVVTAAVGGSLFLARRRRTISGKA
ncbi:hypothetical protein [Streptomyces sp. NPDC020681]|uniref:hypothetical protein n=1 Tax=Streptomyces sp. NPDC020681 TaxID=3365083 RepID=UPI0037B55CEA